MLFDINNFHQLRICFVIKNGALIILMTLTMIYFIAYPLWTLWKWQLMSNGEKRNFLNIYLFVYLFYRSHSHQFCIYFFIKNGALININDAYHDLLDYLSSLDFMKISVDAKWGVARNFFNVYLFVYLFVPGVIRNTIEFILVAMSTRYENSPLYNSCQKR